MNDASGIIKNQQYAKILGKALFWDINVGSDGQACASCHYAGGADIRLKNQVNPGPDNRFDDKIVGGTTGPNQVLSPREFPFFQLSDITDRDSSVVHDKNDRFTSHGTYGGTFVATTPSAVDDCNFSFDPSSPFHDRNLIFRKVEPRNSPTNINAVFYQRQFWDGRANNTFNGVDPFGRRTLQANPAAGVLRSTNGSVDLERITLSDSSLASQAVGPPLSSFEMSCAQRKWANIAKKLLNRKALQDQRVHHLDSLFSSVSGLINPTGVGLSRDYVQLIEAAFENKYWTGTGRFSVRADGSVYSDPNGLTLKEHNFAMFYGLALQAYQATLVSDEAPIDTNPSGLSTSASRGFELFVGKGKCANCHDGPLLSGAAIPPRQLRQLVENMPMGFDAAALYDGGFYNIGVTPTSEDIGVGGVDPYGNTLSHTRQWIELFVNGTSPLDPEVNQVDPSTFESPLSDNPGFREAVDGAFKTPTLRNIGLTPPYFHDGSAATLKQVVQFYNRGGNRQGSKSNDSSGFGRNASNLDADIRRLGLSDREVDDIVAFMLTLTDNRVACHSGVFDHPELPLTRGHEERANANGTAVDEVSVLPAVGRDGLSGLGKPCFANSGRLYGDMQTTFASITSFTPGFSTADQPDSTAGFGVYACPSVSNIASEGLASQSSDHGSNRHPAQLAIDGSYSTLQHTGGPGPDSWRLEYETDMPIHEIRLHNRRDGWRHRMRDIYVSVLDAGGSEVFRSGLLNPGDVLRSPASITVTLPAPVAGRTVIVTRTPDYSLSGISDQTALTLSEVEVFGCEPPSLEPPHQRQCNASANLARAGTARQSSDHGSFPARNAIDGNRGNFTHTRGGQSPSWWEVTYDADVAVGKLVLHNRSDCCQDRLRDITATVLDASGGEVFSSRLLNPENAVSSPSSMTLNLVTETGEEVVGRTVRISRTPDTDQSAGSNVEILSLAEVEVEGCGVAVHESELYPYNTGAMTGTWSGTDFAQDCGPGQVLVGVQGRFGWGIDAMGAVCASVDAAGGWTTAVNTGPMYGGGGGSHRRVVCPAGMAVTGFSGTRGINSFSSGTAGSVQLICRRLLSPAAVSGSESRTSRAGSSGPGATTQRCNGSDPARGLYGTSSGLYLIGYGLTCVGN